MSRVTKAIVFPEPKRVEVREVLLPELGPRDVLVRTLYSGISIGTETWTLLNRYKGTIDAFPFIPGYQRSGVVEAAGAAVTRVRPGDRVFVRACRLAKENDIHPASWNGHVGASVCDESQVFPLPAGCDEKEAAFGIQIAVGCLGVRMSRVSQGDIVVVVGQGLIGQMSAQAAKRRGAFVIAADLLSKRVELSARYSADLAIDASKEDLVRAVHRETAGAMADVVVEATGRASMFDACVDLVRREGTICMQGYYPDLIQIEGHHTHLKRVHVNFPCAWDDDDVRSILRGLAKGTSAVRPLITHEYPVDEAPAAYAHILDHPGDVLGVLIDWTGK